MPGPPETQTAVKLVSALKTWKVREPGSSSQLSIIVASRRNDRARERRLPMRRERGFEGGDDVDDGAVKQRRGWQTVPPANALRVNGRKIPQQLLSDATVLFGLRRLRVVGDALGQGVLAVPVLPDPRIRESTQDRRGRRGPIGWQHRLPDRVHANVARLVLLQNLFDCGGPPQTSGSSR
jgi:hypothetical protein